MYLKISAKSVWKLKILYPREEFKPISRAAVILKSPRTPEVHIVRGVVIQASVHVDEIQKVTSRNCHSETQKRSVDESGGAFEELTATVPVNVRIVQHHFEFVVEFEKRMIL